LMAKGDVPDATELSSKFDEVQQIIAANLISLTKIKEEKEAAL
jgi:hypothetical protein